MKNFIGNGNSVQLAAPAGGVVGGKAYKIGALHGVAVADAAEGELFTLSVKGIFTLTKTAAEAWTVGQLVYLNAAGTSVTTTAAGNTIIGFAASNQLAADVLGDVLLSN